MGNLTAISGGTEHEIDGEGPAGLSGTEATRLPDSASAAPRNGSSDAESSVVKEDDPRDLSPEASFWLVTVGLVFVAIGVLLTIRRLRSRR